MESTYIFISFTYEIWYMSVISPPFQMPMPDRYCASTAASPARCRGHVCRRSGMNTVVIRDGVKIEHN